MDRGLRQWFDAPAEGAVVAVALSASLGPVLQYAIFVCTQHNSALTTTVGGALKYVATTYVGMCLGGDYAYSLVNFAGITVSCVASLVYSWAVQPLPRLRLVRRKARRVPELSRDHHYAHVDRELELVLAP